MNKQITKFPAGFIEAIEDCVSMLEYEIGQDKEIEVLYEPLPSLLQQCEQLAYGEDQQEPIRTIHHFACTGGTLIAKCLASMPSTHVLSEVEPHSRMQSKMSFSPTDLTQLLRRSTRSPSVELQSNVFLNALGAIYDNCMDKGLHLILRDHSHSKYCCEDIDQNIPSLLETVTTKYETLSILTVRHPLDSYLSLTNNNWLHFHPTTIEEYSRRYIQFLNDNEDFKVFKYENLVGDGGGFMKDVCAELQLQYFPGFEDVFGAHVLSGDSGRSSNKLGKRERRVIPEKIQAELEGGATPNLNELCLMLDYNILQ